MTKREQLEKLLNSKNPNLAIEGIFKNIPMIKGDPGEQGVPGYTPIKGKDYYTANEIDAMVSYIQSRVKNGDKGDSGEPGIGIPGKNGETPVLGRDYWTEKDQEKILKDLLSKIPKPKDGVSPDVKSIIESVKSEIPQVNFKDEVGKILATPGFRMLLRGGGLSSVATDSTLTGNGTATSPLHVVAAGGATAWGSITGTLSAQTDLQSALNAKQDTVTLTTTGTSGAATLVGATLNIPNYTYTLPTASTIVLGGVKVDGTTVTIAGGVISATASGLAWGSSIAGTTADGLTLNLSNSADASASAFKVVGGNTQTNISTLANLQLGTSTKVQGLLIQGTGNAVGGGLGTGRNHLTLWQNTLNGYNTLFVGANGSTFNPTSMIDADGGFALKHSGQNYGAAWFFEKNSRAGSGICFVQTVSPTSSATTTLIDTTQTTGLLGTVFDYATQCMHDGNAYNFTIGNNFGTKLTTARTIDFAKFNHVRLHGNNSVTDNFDQFVITRDNRKNGTGTTLVQGSALYIANLYTQTTGTLTDSVDVLKISQNANSTGYLINALQDTTSKFTVDKNGNITTGIWQGTIVNQAYLGTGGGGSTKFLREDNTWQTVAGTAGIYNQTPTGTLNGTNKIFTTASAFSANTTRVYLNGIRQLIGVSNDYIESSNTTITFTVAPLSTDFIIIDYNP